jgi:hypothetical protein
VEIEKIFQDLTNRFRSPEELQRIRQARASSVGFVVSDADNFMNRVFVAALMQDVRSVKADVTKISCAVSRSSLPLLSSSLGRLLHWGYRLTSGWPPAARHLAAFVLKKSDSLSRYVRDRGRRAPHL